MAKVPVYNVPTVSPENISDIRGYANAQTAGAGIGQAISGIGNQISQGGDMLAANALRMQQQLNQADADEAMSRWVIDQGQLDVEFNTLEGKKRAEAFPTYTQKTQQLRDKYANSMGNPEARRLFNNETRRLAAYSIRNGAAATATGLKQYNTQANTNLITIAEQTVMSNPDSDGAFQEALDTGTRAIRQQAQNASWDDETTNLKLETLTSTLWRKRIEAIAKDNPEKGVELYEANKSKLNPTDKSAVESAIYSGQQKAGTLGALVVQDVERAVVADLVQTKETGVMTDLTYDQVRKVLGSAKANEWELKRNDAIMIWNNTKNLPTATREQMRFDLERITPVPGTKDYDRQLARYNAVKKAQEEQLDLRDKDPAASVAKDPLVADAIRNATAVTGGRDDPQWQAVVGDARMAAQGLAGIPRDERSPATVAEILPLIAPLNRMLPGQEGKVIEEVAKNFKDKYGVHAERVFNQALFANRYSNEVREVAGRAMQKLLRGDMPTPTEVNTIQDAAQTGAADSVLKKFFNPPSQDPVDTTTVYPDAPVIPDARSPQANEFGIIEATPTPNPKPKEPISKRILKEMGTR